MTSLSALAPLELIGLVVSVVLTLMVFSYLLGRNPVYRLALHIFLGATVGYAFGVVTWEILVVRIGVPLVVQQRWVVLVPLLLAVGLLFKLFPRRAYLGNASIAFLAGIGAAVAVSGAVLGTLVPIVGATARAASPQAWPTLPLGWLDGVLLVAGTVVTLVAFQYIGRRAAKRGPGCAWPSRAVGRIGRWFLIVAFGVLFGGALSTALTIFVGRAEFLVSFVESIFR